MSLTASRGAALLAPLPQDVPLAATDDASLAMRATVEANATAASAPDNRAAADAVQAASRGNAAKPAPTPVVDTATPATVAAPATFATPAPVAKTTTVAQVGKPAAMPQAPAPAGGIGSAIFALVMVLGLILALAWLARRMPGFRGTSANAALRVVGSLSLGPRERVVVVAVGNTQLVLGVGAGGTRTLHTLGEPLPVAEQATTPAFAQLLSQHFGKKA